MDRMDGVELRTWRRECGLKQEDLAVLLEVSQSAISQMENRVIAISTEPQKLWDEEPKNDLSFDPSMEQDIRDLMVLAPEDLKASLEWARGHQEREASEPETPEESRRWYEKHSGKLAASRPKVPVSRNSRFPPGKRKEPRPDGKMKRSWMPGKEPKGEG